MFQSPVGIRTETALALLDAVNLHPEPALPAVPAQTCPPPPLILLKTCLQPYAGLLPPRVLAPGQAMGKVTKHMAKLTGLSEGCVVCAGTSGEAAPASDLLMPFKSNLDENFSPNSSSGPGSSSGSSSGSSYGSNPNSSSSSDSSTCFSSGPALVPGLVPGPIPVPVLAPSWF